MFENKHYITGISILKLQMLFHYSRNNNVDSLCRDSMVLFNDIFQLFEKIKPAGNNNYRQVWFKIPRGKYTDGGFKNDEEACEYFEVDNPSELVAAFESWFPREEYWLEIESICDDGFRLLRIGNLVITIASKDNTSSDRQEYDYSAILSWVKKGLTETIEECRDGDYNNRVDRELPYTLRYGVISRKKLWDHHPEYRQHNLKDLSQKEVQNFIELLQREKRTTTTPERIKEMTFRRYFEFAAKAFDAAGLRIEGATSFTLFERYGEDFGGRIVQSVDHDSPQDFLRYYNGELRAGGHPWGLLRGSSRSRIMLYPQMDDKGFYFVFAGNPNWSIYEMVKMYSALYEAGLPVIFSQARETISYLLEEDLVGIVTENDMCVYCQSAFSEKINDFYHFQLEQDIPIKNLITWQPVHKVYLLDENGNAIMTEALGYVRYEKQDDRYGEIANTAAEHITQYCYQKGYPLVDLYRDFGSGHDRNRGEIEYILSHLGTHLFDVLIVDAVEHIGLDAGFLLEFVRALNENGKKIYEAQRDIEVTPEIIKADFSGGIYDCQKPNSMQAL